MTTPLDAPGRNSGFDADLYKPRRKPGATLYDRGPDEAEEKRYLLTRDDGTGQLVLSCSEEALWQMFDGEKSVNDVCQEYLGRHRTLVLTRLYSLIQRLWESGFLEQDPEMAGAGERGALEASRWCLTNWCQVKLPGTAVLGRGLGALLQRLPMTSPLAICLVLALILGGIMLFSGLNAMHPYPLLRIGNMYDLPVLGLIPPSYILGVLLLLLLHLVGSFVHALARLATQVAFSIRHLGAPKADSLRLVFNYFIPAFRHDPKWIAALPSQARLLAGASGVVAELLLAAACALALTFGLFEGAWRELLYKFVYVLYLRSFLHLSPMSGSDFPWLMQVLSDIRFFRRKAFGYLRYSLVPMLRGEMSLAVEHKFYLAFNLVSAFWMGLAAAFAFSMLLANQYMLHNLAYALANSQEIAQQITISIDMAILAEERYFVLLLVSLALLFVFGMLLGSIGWGIYVLWNWLRGLPIWRQPMVLISAGLIGMLFCMLLLYLLSYIHMIEHATGVYYLHWGSIAIGLVGALMLFNQVRDEGLSQLTFRTCCFALAMLGSTAALVFESFLEAVPQARTAYLAVLGLLILAYLIGLTNHLHPLAFRKTQLFLPELAILIGAVVLAVSALRGLQNDPALLFLVDNNRFVGMALILIGNGVILRSLHDLSMPLESFAIEVSHERPDESLKRILANIMESQARLLASKIGEHGLEAIERRMNRGSQELQFGFSSLFIPEESTPEEIGQLYRVKLLDEERMIASIYGKCFAHRVMDRVFQILHWECKMLVESYLLPGTQWAGAYGREAELDAEARTRLINAISIFNELAPNERQLLVRHTLLLHYEPGELIIRQGQYGESCFVLVDGEVQVEERDPIGETSVIAFLRSGDFFGETALLQQVPRVASVRATTRCRLLALRRDDFDKFGQQYPEMVHRIRDRLHNLLALLRIPIFGDLPTTLLRSILPRVRSERFDAGRDIIVQGDIGKSFYLIKLGRVKVMVTLGGDEEEEICELGPRDYFGEIALLKDIPRTATVRASERVEVLVLEKEDFFQLVRGSRLFAHSLQVVGENRLASN